MKLTEEEKQIIETLGNCKIIYCSPEQVIETKKKPHSIIFQGEKEYIIPLDGLVDFDKEKERIIKQLSEAKILKEKQEKKLSNEGFIKNAKPEVIELERKKLEDQTDIICKLEKVLNRNYSL